MVCRSKVLSPRWPLAMSVMLFVGFGVSARAENPSSLSIQELREQLQQQLSNNAFRKMDYGIGIAFLDTGEMIFARNENRLLLPASTIKTATTYAALKKLGRDYTFSTSVFVDHYAAESGVVQGNIYLKGGGDPSFTYDALWSIARALRTKGITSIDKDLVYDESFIAGDKVISREFGREKWYNPPTNALSLNKNLMTVVSIPDRATKQPVLRLSPENPYIHIESQILKTKRRSKTVLFSLSPLDDADARIAEGIIISSSRREDSVPLQNPALYTAITFKDLLLKEGIEFKGKVVAGTVPSNLYPLHVYESQPLSMVIHNVNKHSCNFTAEQITKTLGARLHKTTGTTLLGVSVVKEFLSTLGIYDANYTMENGSGLTRATRMAPKTMMKILFNAYRDQEINHEYISSFGIYGEDGTVRHRAHMDGAAVRVKSGSLGDVSSLAGYVISKDSRPMVFTMMFNNINPYRPEVVRFQNSICKLLSTTSIDKKLSYLH